MKVKIEIDTKTFIRFWLVVIAFTFVILAIYSARDALILIATALFLALALNAPVSYLAKYLPHKSRVGGTAIAFLIVIAFLFVILFLVVPPIVQQTMKFFDTIPSLVNEATTQTHGLDGLISKYQLQPQIDSAVNSIKEGFAGWAAGIGQNVLSGVGSVASTVGSSFLVIVLSFLMLIEGPMWLKRLWGVYNDEERMEAHRALIHRMYTVVTGYVTGQLTVSTIGSLATGIAVFLLSLAFPEVSANLALPAVAIAFILSLIPMFGATIGGVIITLLLVANNLTAGVIFGIYFIVYQQIENNFISPTIQSKRVELSPLAVLVSVTVGIYVFGLAGGIISIPIAGCIKVLLEDYLTRARRNREKSERPMAKLVKKLQGEEV
ncbi:MAG TPA: AI-2E family transporter [Candidatus Saccharimonadales bacterium]|nr:AI-2E family transporter [Candidatus Saccharimonadales bacterium]